MAFSTYARRKCCSCACLRYLFLISALTDHYLRDGDLLMAEVNASGTVIHSYTWGLAGLSSDRVSEGPGSSWMMPRGNTRVLLDANGNVLGRGTRSVGRRSITWLRRL